MSKLDAKSVVLAGAALVASAGAVQAGQQCSLRSVETWKAAPGMHGHTAPVALRGGTISVDPSGAAYFHPRGNSEYNKGGNALGIVTGKNDDPRIEGRENFKVHYGRDAEVVTIELSEVQKGETAIIGNTAYALTPNHRGVDVITIRDLSSGFTIKAANGSEFNLQEIHLKNNLCRRESDSDNDRGTPDTGKDDSGLGNEGGSGGTTTLGFNDTVRGSGTARQVAVAKADNVSVTFDVQPV